MAGSAQKTLLKEWLPITASKHAADDLVQLMGLQTCGHPCLLLSFTALSSCRPHSQHAEGS